MNKFPDYLWTWRNGCVLLIIISVNDFFKSCVQFFFFFFPWNGHMLIITISHKNNRNPHPYNNSKKWQTRDPKRGCPNRSLANTSLIQWDQTSKTAKPLVMETPKEVKKWRQALGSVKKILLLKYLKIFFDLDNSKSGSCA